MNSLFTAHPALESFLPCADIASLPTPVEALPGLGIEALYVKRDDLSATPYGGNKIRKLAPVLGHAHAAGCEAVLTYGCVGSNHALATAIYAAQLGLRAYSVLVPQHNAHAVRRNILRHHISGASMRFCAGGRQGRQETRRILFSEHARCGKFPLVIAPGGSSPVGTLGFVDAAFELRAQAAAGLLPEPDVVYAPTGTMGTCIGLALGFAAAGMKTRVEGVAVSVPPYTSEAHGRILFEATRDMLRACCASFPDVDFDDARFTLRHGFLGASYGLYTEAGMDAVARARDAGLKLEGTYTGKAFAALLEDANAGALEGKTVLYWDTYNSRDLSADIADVDYHALPAPFHRYFEEPVQPLDQPTTL